MGLNPEIRQAMRAALKKLDAELAKKEDDPERPTFKTRPVSNGYLATFADIEEYETEVPVYDPPGSPGGPGRLPKYEKRKRWRLVQREVYCADAAAIKIQVDEALALEEKIRLLIAEGALGGNDEPGVGSF